jgi:hypothetical protein
VQSSVIRLTVPLKVRIEPGTKEFPLDWPAMSGWSFAYWILGGERNSGFTGCSVVSPDLTTELASTGSAHVWEIFDSPGYDPAKFLAMLERGFRRHEEYEAVLADPGLDGPARDRKLARLRESIRQQVGREGATRWPPKGFTIEKALELFRMTGDYQDD